MKNILVTGGAGFIGSNFIINLLNKQLDYAVVNIDLLTYAGNLNNLKEVERHPQYQFVQGDVADRALIEPLFKEYQFHGIIHFAAETHVDNSIASPEAFVKTNVMGTFTLLDVAYKNWMEAPSTCRLGCDQNRFLHISTDEVYGSLGRDGLFTEKSPFAPNSPYAASKASADMLVRSYYHTYGMNVVTTNCSNNYGPKQHPEKLIPTIIRKAVAGEPIPIYGDGLNIRDWLYVIDHCEAIQMVFETGKAGETYNIGGRNEYTNLEIAGLICNILDELSPRLDGLSFAKQITHVKDRAGHDRRYAIDATKIETELGWKRGITFQEAIKETVQWYLENIKQ